MGFGVILHGRAFLGAQAESLIVLVSYIFRMPTFFIISGFFTAMVFTRGTSFASRLRLILVPFAFFLLCANPLAIAALYHIAGVPLPEPQAFLGLFPDDARFPLKPSWHLHLWFLLALGVFTCAYPVLRWLIGKISLEKLNPERHPGLAFTALLILVAGASFASYSVYNLTLENWVGTTSLNYTLLSSFRLFPFFALGVLFFHAPKLFELFHRCFCLHFALAVAAVIFLELNPDIPGYNLLSRAAKAGASVCSANLLFFLFRRFFAGESKSARLFSDSAYTIYLLHYYVLIAFYALLFTPGMNSPALFALAVIACYALCLFLHVFVVSRFKLTRLLINGKTA